MSNRRNLINQYLNQIEDNNNNISHMLSVMNNQENTLRRLLFESDIRSRNIFNPTFPNIHPTPLNRNSNHQLRNSRNNLSNLNLLNLDNILNGFFENIINSPSREQINRAIENKIYSSIESPLNTTCPIGLRSFEDNEEVSIIRFCSHIFSKEDLELWFQENTRCPLCRYDIRNYFPTSN
jgi:hypothetical protein